MSLWREVSPHDLQSIPTTAGLYCVYADRRLAYVGQAKNLRSRLNAQSLSASIHEGVWKGLRLRDIRLKISERTGSEKDRIKLENKLIRRALPLLNTRSSALVKGRHCRLAFANEMHLEYG